MKLRRIGFWRGRGEANARLPDPRDFIDPEWDPEERWMVVEYLRAGRFRDHQMGVALCRLCGVHNGSGTQADAAYAWPEGLAHYLEAHAVRLPEAFVEHVRAPIHADEEASADPDWWIGQAPTGTRRSWPGFRVSVRAPVATSQLAATIGACTSSSREEVWRALRGDGKVEFTLADEILLREVKGVLEACGAQVSAEAEEVRAPDELLG